jgi:ribonuclease Z
MGLFKAVSPTKVILLGTGNPNPNPHNSGPSLLVLVDDTPYVFDFGTGIMRQASALTPQYGGNIKNLEIKNIKTSFLTHMHSDHTLGYADLIITPWLMGRDAPLEVYGPDGLVSMTKNILNAYRDDIEYRVYGSEPINNHQGWHTNAHEISEGLVYRDDNIKVEAFLVNHGTWSNAYGYRITSPDKIIVISGDTAPCKNIIKFGCGADILIHEVYYKKGYDKRDILWKKYHSLHHTSTYQLAEIANRIKPKLMVLTHTLFWGGSEQDILAEIAEIYPGKVVAGTDLDVFQ